MTGPSYTLDRDSRFGIDSLVPIGYHTCLGWNARHRHVVRGARPTVLPYFNRVSSVLQDDGSVDPVWVEQRLPMYSIDQTFAD